MGRPSDYTEQTGLEICQKLIEGMSLRSICLAESMPSIATVMNWLTKFPTFLEQYERAREAQADTLADEMLDIADDASNDWMERSEKQGGGYELNGEHVQRSRLRLDTRKWIASKLKSKRYGDKVETTHKGDAAAPIMITATDSRL